MSFENRPIRALLADDEPPARSRLRQMLAQLGGVEVVEEAVDGDEALEKIRRLRPDLVFLDVEMPGRNGIQVAAELQPPRPHVVFCTAYDRYAVDAFEQHAVDYLMKPVNRVRLERSVERVRESLGAGGRLADELRQAGATQARLFPQRLPALASLDYAGTCRPAGGVGGDYYDFFEVAPGELALALGDVSGKGMPAALLMASLQGQRRTRVQQGLGLFGALEPAALTGELNRSLCELTDQNRFITFFFGVYDEAKQTLRYCNAGHNPPLVLRAAGDGPADTERLAVGGTVLGIFPEAVYVEHQAVLEENDLAVFFSDGISEATDAAGREFGEGRLAERVLARRGLAAAQLRDRLLEDVAAFSQGPQEDDMTLIVLRVKERRGEP